MFAPTDLQAGSLVRYMWVGGEHPRMLEVHITTQTGCAILIIQCESWAHTVGRECNRVQGVGAPGGYLCGELGVRMCVQKAGTWEGKSLGLPEQESRCGLGPPERERPGLLLEWGWRQGVSLEPS